MKTFLLFFHLSVCSLFLSAQTPYIDSLKNVLQTQTADTSKANTLNDLSISYWQVNDYDNAHKCAEQALTFSEKNNYKNGKARAHYNKALIYTSQYNYPKALENYNFELKIREQSRDTLGIGWSNLSLARVNSWMENYPVALSHYYVALRIFEKKDDKRSIAVALSEIGVINALQNNNAEALENYETAIKLYEKLGLAWGVAGCYSSMAEIHLTEGKFSEALRKDSIALKIFMEYKDVGNTGKMNGAYVLLHIGNILEQQSRNASSNDPTNKIPNKYAEAMKVYLMALKIYNEVDNEEGIALCYLNLGNLNLELKNLKDAKRYLEESLDIAVSIGSKSGLRDSHRGLATIDSLSGNYAGALEHYKMHIIYRDSLFNVENTKKIVQSQMNYEFDKKESLTKAEQEKKDAIALKEMQRQKLVRNGFVGGFAIVLLFAGVFFKQRNKIKTSKKRSDELLLNILPSEVAEELKAKGSADAKQFDDVTVMFTDFKNFTRISETLSPSELVTEIHTCFKTFDTIIGKHNIEKIKTIGDSYMCAGGLPVANTTNAMDVVNAAVEIQQFIQGHSQQRKEDGKEPFEIRIGVHTGPVVAGIVGIKKFAYDIWGDTVNIASRMESSGEAGKVNISGSTYELVKAKFACTHRGKIQAKNKGEIDMYFVEHSI